MQFFFYPSLCPLQDIIVGMCFFWGRRWIGGSCSVALGARFAVRIMPRVTRASGSGLGLHEGFSRVRVWVKLTYHDPIPYVLADEVKFIDSSPPWIPPCR